MKIKQESELPSWNNKLQQLIRLLPPTLKIWNLNFDTIPDSIPPLRQEEELSKISEVLLIGDRKKFLPRQRDRFNYGCERREVLGILDFKKGRLILYNHKKNFKKFSGFLNLLDQIFEKKLEIILKEKEWQVPTEPSGDYLIRRWI